MKKRILLAATSFFLLIGIAVLFVPFLSSLKPSAKAEANNPQVVIDLTALVVGKPTIFKIFDVPLFVLKPNQEQFDSIARLTPYVADTQVLSYNDKLGIYIYWAIGRKNYYYCLVSHKPNPHTMSYQSKWSGGYFGLGCDISYDYAGRAIKNIEYGFINYGGDFESLPVPKYSIIDDNKISVTQKIS